MTRMNTDLGRKSAQRAQRGQGVGTTGDLMGGGVVECLVRDALEGIAGSHAHIEAGVGEHVGDGRQRVCCMGSKGGEGGYRLAPERVVSSFVREGSGDRRHREFWRVVVRGKGEDCGLPDVAGRAVLQEPDEDGDYNGGRLLSGGMRKGVYGPGCLRVVLVLCEGKESDNTVGSEVCQCCHCPHGSYWGVGIAHQQSECRNCVGCLYSEDLEGECGSVSAAFAAAVLDAVNDCDWRERGECICDFGLPWLGFDLHPSEKVRESVCPNAGDRRVSLFRPGSLAEVGIEDVNPVAERLALVMRFAAGGEEGEREGERGQAGDEEGDLATRSHGPSVRRRAASGNPALVSQLPVHQPSTLNYQPLSRHQPSTLNHQPLSRPSTINHQPSTTQ